MTSGRHRAPPPSTVRVLVVEDEAPLAALVSSYLDLEGFEVATASDGEAAIARVREWLPDVVILDLGLPGADGIEVCRSVRTFSDCYVIMLTARAEEIDKLVGLSVGADDYLTKPFSPRELMARVRVLLRRPRGARGEPPAPPQELWTFGPLTIDPGAREARLQGDLVDLTRTEFDVLATLAAHPRMVVTRHQLIREVWGTSWVNDDRFVDVHISHLRRKLGDDPSSPTFIRTVRGVGYRMGSGT